MTPKQGGSAHNYPFYKRQKDGIKKEGYNEPGYIEREEMVAERLGLDITEVLFAN